MKSHHLAIVFLAFTCCTAQARIGEGLMETQGRYGRPDPNRTGAKDQYLYNVGGLQIVVTFRNNKSVRERISKNGQPFTDDDLQSILDANVGAHSWVESAFENRPRYDRVDGGVVIVKNDKDCVTVYAMEEWKKAHPELATATGFKSL